MTRAPSIPCKVLVGPIDYEVRLGVSEVVALTGGNDRGGCDPQAAVIAMDDELSAGQLRVTLLHEVLHALMDVTGVGSLLDGLNNDDLEEHVVRSLAPALTSVLRNNPTLVACLVAK